MKSILVIDDEEGILEVLEDYLGLNDFRVTRAQSVESAIAILEGQDFNGVITDIRMPGGSGVILIRWIQEHRPHLPIMVITGFSRFSHDELKEMGVKKVFEKPFLIDDLCSEIGRVF